MQPSSFTYTQPTQPGTSIEDGEANAQTTKKGKKKPAYSGGLVLEPKRGMWFNDLICLQCVIIVMVTKPLIKV